MKFLNREIKAAIFDMDGTLIDSTGIWHEIDKAFFAKRGMDIPKEYMEEIVHIGLNKAATFTKEKYHIKESEDEIRKEWKDASIEMYVHKIPLKSYALELLTYLKKQNIKLALATANDEELYKPCLERLGLSSFFDVIMDVNSVQSGKDNVKLYNTISEKLGVCPEETLVFEDIATPLKTAFNGGYISIAVYDEQSVNQNEAKEKYSYKFIKSFKEILDQID